jgi:hypothetical protein
VVEVNTSPELIAAALIANFTFVVVAQSHPQCRVVEVSHEAMVAAIVGQPE